ncbi:MAG TPA: Spy/CpxP family protein refolding chaperone [Vicingaceae bacterium]|nr:Spy/CpxP family protein refolding chaperone [Vicingaceae bacterium]
MKTLKVLAAATLFFLGTTMVNAQEPAKKECTHEHGMKAHKVGKEHHLEKMKAELQLTDEQVAKIKEIHAKRADEKEALKEKMHELHKAEKEEVKQVLTEEQLQKMKELKAEKHKNMKAHKAKKAKMHAAPVEKE